MLAMICYLISVYLFLLYWGFMLLHENVRVGEMFFGHPWSLIDVHNDRAHHRLGTFTQLL
ncbi:hypothetical protein BV22DRAFT_782714 [Leucogyrophana mollusca]|uniref:Uncharacterized protein n=1 Tax=Leucogyrophana mollusca TaxID=85980 RepID=A0ACB8B645_9AGAM|nr:hypothetical protein BV22DRAFT_782714 [Leucogyrophana mollusca]